MKTTILYLTISILIPLSLAAQSTEPAKKDAFSANITYQSLLHYFGRTDSLQSSGDFATIGFQSKSGLYLQGNIIFTQNKVQPMTYAGTLLEGGYRWNGDVSGNLFYSQFLYGSNTKLVQSALKSQTGINLAYNNPVLNLNAGADLKFSNQTDVGFTFGVDHLFLFKTENSGEVWALNPSLYSYFGTQQFSNTYIEKKNVLGIPVTQTTTSRATQLNILSYEFALPVVFVSGKWNASFTPSYVIPQNLITVAGRPDLSEQGNSRLYFSLSLGVKL
jgi:hypothetical protein